MPELRPLFDWRLPTREDVTPELMDAGLARGLTPRSIGVLAARGHRTPEAITTFLDDPVQGLHDPALLPDADRVRDRIRDAMARRERVLVFGDFDADGLTGLAILVLALRRLGLDAEPYVPSRIEEGHGLSLPAIDRASREGRTLIVTADCGSSSVEEVAHAQAVGIDVVITDHHRVPARTPDAAAFVNPHRPGSRYADDRLSGSGVAFKVAQLLLADAPRAGNGLDLVDLAAIGTVADVAPLVGENRCIVRLGLQQMRGAPRAGIAALLGASRLDRDRLDVEAIAYDLAPRLNASGRVGDGSVAARLLLADDASEAEAIAAEVDIANHARRELTQSALEEARAAVAGSDAPVTIVVGDWSVGVIGLVAGRLAEERARPAVVLTRAASPWRGSARSANGFDLAAAFAGCAELFHRFGGHAAAAGCTLPEDAFDAFRRHLLATAPPLVARRPTLALDLVIDADRADYGLLRELELLEPTGAGNQCPMVGITGLVATRVRSTAGGHTQLTLRKGREVVDGIAFGRSDLGAAVHEGDRVDVVARLRSRVFGGYESLQLDLRDVAPGGHLADLARRPPEAAVAMSGTQAA